MKESTKCNKVDVDNRWGWGREIERENHVKVEGLDFVWIAHDKIWWMIKSNRRKN